MPVVIPKPPPPLKPVDLAPQPPAPVAPAGLSLADVQKLLDSRDAIWARQLGAMEKRLADAMAANKPAPRTGAKITIQRDLKGVLTGAEIIPKA